MIRKITIILMLSIALFLLGCQVSEKLKELTADSAAAESPEEGEIADELNELDDLNQILDEDIDDLKELEDLELE